MPKNHSTSASQPYETTELCIGKVIGFLGLKGVLKIGLATNNPSLFLNIKDVKFCLSAEKAEMAKVKSVRLNKQVIELLLHEHSTRSSVEHLLHAKVFVQQSQIAVLPENEWWVKDLVGMKVFTTEGTFIGTICDALGKDGQFLEVKRADADGGDTVLIPFVRPLVPVVDMKAGRVEVVNLPGLLD